MSKLRTALSLLVLAALPFALSCSSAPTEVVSREPVALVVLDPETATLQVGKSLAITAFAVDTTGRPQQNRQMFWASSNTSIATVSNSGLVRGLAPGRVDIAASAEGKSAVSRVTVIPRAVDRVTITPDRGEVMIGRTLDLTANVFDDENGRLNGRTVSWSSNAEHVATVSSSGRVTARAAGTATITATSEGKSGTAQITVRPVPVHRVVVSAPVTQLRPGETLQLSAQTLDESNNVLTGRSVSWSTSNSSVATVSGTGLVNAQAPGSVTITATSEGRSGSVTLTVQQHQVATVSVSPSSATLDIGGTTDLQATARTADGTVLIGREVSWQSSNSAVATVNSNGRVTAVGAGSATITATVDGRSGTASITVRQPAAPPPQQPPPVASVTVAPSSATLDIGQSIDLTATLRAADGTVLTGRVVTWQSSNALVATVSSSGRVTALSAGSATITATSEGRSGTSAITVRAPAPPTGPGPIVRVEITPSSATLSARNNETVLLQARAYDAQGTQITGTSVTWSSNNTSVATVTSGGLVRAISPGNAVITARISGVAGTAEISVNNSR